MSEEDAGYPSDKADKVLVRMPDGMRDRMKAAAKANNRTMNAEIVARLQQSMEIDQATPGLIGSDPTVQKIAAEHMYKASMELIKIDPEFKQGIQEMMAKAILIAHNKRHGLEDGDLRLVVYETKEKPNEDPSKDSKKK